MIQANCRHPRILRATLPLFIVTLLCGVPIGFAAESAAPSSLAQEQKNQPAETEDIQVMGPYEGSAGEGAGRQESQAATKPARRRAAGGSSATRSLT